MEKRVCGTWDLRAESRRGLGLCTPRLPVESRTQIAAKAQASRAVSYVQARIIRHTAQTGGRLRRAGATGKGQSGGQVGGAASLLPLRAENWRNTHRIWNDSSSSDSHSSSWKFSALWMDGWEAGKRGSELSCLSTLLQGFQVPLSWLLKSLSSTGLYKSSQDANGPKELCFSKEM